jgi:hypothetical protein
VITNHKEMSWGLKLPNLTRNALAKSQNASSFTVIALLRVVSVVKIVAVQAALTLTTDLSQVNLERQERPSYRGIHSRLSPSASK